MKHIYVDLSNLLIYMRLDRDEFGEIEKINSFKFNEFLAYFCKYKVSVISL